ncbi:MAG TPA: efflux RND transporter periplasmic adaptor subunit [Stellaceae bacterium]|nr:efflux RND transporter periplasmic adaptor subunit [Stellaceae bacterium]
MDGDLNPIVAPPKADAADTVGRERLGAPRPVADRPKTLRWLLIVGAVLVLVLGGLYGFNRYRSQAISAFFAHNKPPPAAISAVTAVSAAVPHFATGIGSITAVHQVTVTPELGGRVTAIMFKAGAEVAAGDPLVQINDAPDQGDLLNYQAQARWAAVSLDRAKALAQRQAGPQQTVDQTQMQLDEARAQIIKTEAIIAQKLIRAPFAGRLGVRQIDLGQYLNAGAPIVTLTDLKHLFVNFTLPSTERGEIATGQSVNVTADAFPGRTFTATITTIDPQIRADTRTLTVQATLANPDEALLPGMFVNAAVVLPAQPDQVVLPATAVDYTLYGDSVYVIRKEDAAAGKPVLKAVRTPVKTGARWDNKVAILSGVKPGEEVVAAGQIKLQDGAQVTVTGNPPPQPPAHPTPQ